MIFGEIDSFFSLFDRIKKFFASKNKYQTSETVASRFVSLFECHGVHRNQIPRFFGYGLTIADVSDDETLLPKLTEEILDAACVLFAVRREWLDGAEKQVHQEHFFHKRPEAFLEFLTQLQSVNPDDAIRGIVLSPQEEDRDAEAVLILQETIGYIGDKAIYRFHLCDNWLLSYWKSRTYLTACIAIAWQKGIYVHGVTQPKVYIEQFSYGQTLMGWDGEGIWGAGYKTWYPEDMALRPEAFLKDLDPERENFGIRAGLSLWLELEEQGLMDCGIAKDARKLFEAELAKYT